MSSTATTTGDGLRAAEAKVMRTHGLQPREHLLDLTEPRLRVRVTEFGGDGDPLLLVPGDGGLSCAFAPLVAELGDARRVLVLDRPSFGLGESFDYRGADLRAHAVAVLTSVLDELGLGAVSIAGSSGGGLWSLWLAIDAPERVRRLAPLGSPACALEGFTPTSGARALSLPGLGRLLAGIPSPSAKATGRMLAKTDERLLDHPDLVEAYHAAMRQPGFAAATSATFRAHLRPGGRAQRSSSLTPEELSGIGAPTRFVWGMDEPFGAPEVAGRAASHMPDARVHVIERGWHHPWLADPQTVARLLREW